MLYALCGTKDEADALESKRKEFMRNQYEQRHGFHQIEHALRSAGLASPPLTPTDTEHE